MPQRTSKMLTLRLSDDEAAALDKVIALAQKRTLGCAQVSDVLRELIGFRPFKILPESSRKILEEFRSQRMHSDN